MTFVMKLRICINIVQIVLTFHLKVQGKIANYLPAINEFNIEISQKYNLNFCLLSSLTSNPFYDLTKLVSKILFSKKI
jgi:hypothetical protein